MSIIITHQRRMQACYMQQQPILLVLVKAMEEVEEEEVSVELAQLVEQEQDTRWDSSFLHRINLSQRET